MSVSLQDKFYGCIAGCHVGSAMGAAVEAMTFQRIEEVHGFVEKPLPYMHYNNGWMREAGTTEDGVERQKLMIFAIEHKQGRVTAEDVRAAWLQYANPNAGGWISEPFERTLLDMAKSGIPARDIGKYCDYAGLNSFSRACHAIGLINAGNIETAIEDILEVGQLYQTSNSRGLKWACVTGAAIAAATLPNATVESVIGAIFDHCDKDMVLPELDRHLKGTAHIKDVRELREYFEAHYNGYGMPYCMSYANEVVTKGLCVFQMVKGVTKDAIIAGTNIGRDTDCIAAVASGISGALTGASSIPEEWMTQVDYATTVNPHTCTKRTVRENADIVYNAFLARLQKESDFVAQMRAAI